MSSGMFADDFETDAAKRKRRQDEDYARWATTQQTEALSKAQAQARLAQFKVPKNSPLPAISTPNLRQNARLALLPTTLKPQSDTRCSLELSLIHI